MKKSYYLCLLAMTTLLACETDFEVNAPWKETAVIYGLLDQTVDTQRVIIYKAFLDKKVHTQWLRKRIHFIILKMI